MRRVYKSAVVFHNSLISVLVYPSLVSVAVSNFISYCTEICLSSGLFLSPFSEPFTPSAISRRDQMVRAEHSTLMKNTLLIYAVAQQCCWSYPVDNRLNAFVFKMERRGYFEVVSLRI